MLVVALVVALLLLAPLLDNPAPAPDEPRRTPAVVAAPSATSATESPEPPPARRPLEVGISPGFSIITASPERLGNDLAAARRLGVDRVRVDLSWARIARIPGLLDWSDSDRVITAARAADLEVLVVVSYRPTSAQLADGSPDPVLFGRFVAAAAQRYRDQVFAWEMWTNPNRRSFWSARPSAAAYARVAAAGARAVRTHDPDATIVVGSMSPAVDAGDGKQMSPLTFLRRFYASGIDRSLFDVVSVHPYTYPALPSGRQPWNTYARLLDLYRVMERAGDGEKPMWLTEYGASTGASTRSVSRGRQEQMVLGALREARDLPFVDSLWYYSLRDADSASRDPDEGFGLLDDLGRPKPAYTALRRELRRN